jgi:hypothetical protein
MFNVSHLQPGGLGKHKNKKHPDGYSGAFIKTGIKMEGWETVLVLERPNLSENIIYRHPN